MKTHDVKKSVARTVTKHTIFAAYSTIDCYGVPPEVTAELQADLQELDKLEASPLVDAAKSLVKIAIEHSISPTETTHSLARVARDALADLMIHSREVKG